MIGWDHSRGAAKPPCGGDSGLFKGGLFLRVLRVWYYLMGEEQKRKGAKGILGSGGSFHNDTETRTSMWCLAFIYKWFRVLT